VFEITSGRFQLRPKVRQLSSKGDDFRSGAKEIYHKILEAFPKSRLRTGSRIQTSVTIEILEL
jgi:hypothetical protein